MISRVFAIASAVSLAVAAPFIGLIVWGHWSPAAVVWARNGLLYQITVGRNAIDVTCFDDWWVDQPLVRTSEANRLVLRCYDDPAVSTVWFGARVRCDAVVVAGGPVALPAPREGASYLPSGRVVPLSGDMAGMILYPARCAVLAMILPAAWLMIRFGLCSRVPPGLCRACRYDLRASTDRCPECGTPIPVEVAE